MESVFGLVEYHGGGAVHDRVGDLLAAVGRQAVQKAHVCLRVGQQIVIDLVRAEEPADARPLPPLVPSTSTRRYRPHQHP